MNTKTAKEKASSAKKKFEEKIGKLYFSRGKRTMLNELWLGLSDEKKHKIISENIELTDRGNWSDKELWSGMTTTMRKELFIKLIEKNA